MKKFLLLLMSVGLTAAVSTSALAVDVQFSGSMYVAGIYLDKVGVIKDAGSEDANFSTAFFYQRLRVRTDFIAAPGVKIVTRFDALERVWGGPRSLPSVVPADSWYPLEGLSMSAGTDAENQNIAFDWAYIEYASPVGMFQVGYQEDGRWGTIFGDTSYVNPKISWTLSLDNWTLMAKIVKLMDNSYTAYNNTPFGLTYRSDADNDKYALGAMYSWKSGQAGLLASYSRYAWLRMGDPLEFLSMTSTLYGVNPFVKAQIGPVSIEAEVNYLFGNFVKWDSSSALIGDIQVGDLTGWINATATFGPVYFGATIAYVAGDDLNTTDKVEGGILSGGRDWDPCLLMFNYNDRGKWIGSIYGNGVADNGWGVTNAWLYQGKIGVKPNPQLDIYATITYATVDKKQEPYTIGSDYGWEIDLVGTYKLTKNLTYMIGGAYWFVGDYYKGPSPQQAVNNDYLLINKLTLTF